MRLVEHDKRVGADESRVIGAHLAGNAVTFEKQPRADHVDRADDDRGRSRVFQPCAIVEEFPAQRGNGKVLVALEAQPALQFSRDLFRLRASGCVFDPGEVGGFAIERVAQLLRLLRRLIHHGAPIHDISKPPRQLLAGVIRRASPRNQP